MQNILSMHSKYGSGGALHSSSAAQFDRALENATRVQPSRPPHPAGYSQPCSIQQHQDSQKLILQVTTVPSHARIRRLGADKDIFGWLTFGGCSFTRVVPSGHRTRNPEIPMTRAAKINLPEFSLKLDVPFCDKFFGGKYFLPYCKISGITNKPGLIVEQTSEL